MGERATVQRSTYDKNIKQTTKKIIKRNLKTLFWFYIYINFGFLFSVVLVQFQTFLSRISSEFCLETI